MNGKGSTPRPIKDRRDFAKRWEQTFNRCAVAQPVEQRPVKPPVAGSTPARAAS